MRVTQDMAFVFDLIQGVRVGRLAPASMQRPYVWSKQDVLDLFDSMATQLPIGSICLWQPDTQTSLSASRKSRMATVSTFPDTADKLILDGQNRITTLAWAMTSDISRVDRNQIPVHEQDVWLDGTLLSLDCQTAQFFFAHPSERSNASRLIVPVHILLNNENMRDLMELCKGFTPDEMDALSAQLSTFDRVQRQIMSTRIIVSTIFDASLEDAKRVYARICRAGVPISDSDFHDCMRA